jgi:hypothetical protein
MTVGLLPVGLADKVSESISAAIRLVREIFAERPAATVADSLSRRANDRDLKIALRWDGTVNFF